MNPMNFSDPNEFARRAAEGRLSEDYFYWCPPPLRASEKEQWLEFARSQRKLAGLFIQMGAFPNYRTALRYLRAGGIELLEQIIVAFGGKEN